MIDMDAQPQARVQIGIIKVSGPWVWLARLILIGIVAGIAYLFPPLGYWPMWVSAMGWIAFSVYWGLAAKNAAQAKSAESARSRRVHEVLTNVGILLLFLPLPGLRQSFLPASPAWVPAGLAVLTASVALAIWARRHLGRYWSGRIEIKTNHELVRAGPYRLLRHPIYTAIVGMCAGTALVDGHAHALAGVAVTLFAYWRKVRMEEAKLRESFGGDYEDYRRATWGMIPGLF
jgi:protein-S-isoprenylcysteine O-methyltransferase Ste14